MCARAREENARVVFVLGPQLTIYVTFKAVRPTDIEPEIYGCCHANLMRPRRVATIST
jgi:hypothetical protein